SSLTAPGMCPASYAVVSSSTSTKTMFGAPRFFSAQSALTSADSRLIGLTPRLSVGAGRDTACAGLCPSNGWGRGRDVVPEAAALTPESMGGGRESAETRYDLAA